MRTRRRNSEIVSERFAGEIRGNRRQPFFLEQTTLAKVETYTAILTALILPTVAIHTIEATTTLEPEGMDVATEGVRLKHTESRWLSRSGIQNVLSLS